MKKEEYVYGWDDPRKKSLSELLADHERAQLESLIGERVFEPTPSEKERLETDEAWYRLSGK